MAYDFPASPTTGDTFEDPTSGTKYIWSGTVWDLAAGGDLSDYVLKIGDTMTGGLSFSANVDVNADDFAKHIEIYSGANGMGIGTTTGGNFNFVNKNIGHLQNFRIGGQTRMQVNQYGVHCPYGIDFGSAAVTSAQDLSRHIALYAGTFGFCITGSTLNYNSSTNHQFYGGTTNIMSVTTGAIELRVGTNFRGGLNGYSDLRMMDDRKILHDGNANGYGKAYTEEWRSSGLMAQLWHECNNTGLGEEGYWGLNLEQGGFDWSGCFSARPGTLYADREVSGATVTTRCAAADKSDVRNCTDAETIAAFAALKPHRYRVNHLKQFNRDGEPTGGEDRLPPPKLRWGLIADELYANPATKEIASVDLHGEIQGAEIMQVLVLTVAKLKLVEAELAALKAKVK